MDLNLEAVTLRAKRTPCPGANRLFPYLAEIHAQHEAKAFCLSIMGFMNGYNQAFVCRNEIL